jgi:hypothetical protein
MKGKQSVLTARDHLSQSILFWILIEHQSDTPKQP